MARRYPATGLYASLRWEASGEPTNVLVDSEEFRHSRRRIILLLHGYNVSCKAGHKALKGFESQLRKHSASLAGDVAWLMWPGDWRIPLVSAASYPFMVTATARLGEKIARFMRTLRHPEGGQPEIVVVAHSLGCRVMLEALHELVGKPGLKHVSVLLMAAAVPVDEVEPGGRLRDAALWAARRAVLHSTSDWVLQVAFRLGQRVTPGESGWTEAVGTAGRPPRGLWHESAEMSGFGHSSYWKERKTVAWFVSWMGRAAPRIPPRRRIQRRITPIRRLRAARELPVREVF